MQIILLTQGKFAIVDDEDYYELNKQKWYWLNGYAAHKGYVNGKQTHIFMHRIIMAAPSEKEVDHIKKYDDFVDNRKENLRLCTPVQNHQNSRKTKKAVTSRLKGVSWHSFSKKYEVCIKFQDKPYRLGYFTSEIFAAQVYDAAAVKLFGEFALTNFKQLNPDAVKYIEIKLEWIKNKKKSSQYKGVTWHKSSKKWIVFIHVSGKQKYLGVFASEIDAAQAYDAAALEYLQEKATLNFPDRRRSA